MIPIPGSTVTIPAGQQSFSYSGPQDASSLRNWLMGLLTGVADSDGGPAGQPAHWNYYGDNKTRFDNTTVTGYTPSPGVQIPPNDPLVGATVQMLGNIFFGRTTSPVIVDVDPLALITSQIFSASLKVTAADGTVLIDASPCTRAFSYFIYPSKNVDPNAIGFQGVSAVFICSIPNGSGLTINSAASPALADLARAAAAGAGLNIRYCFYDALYETSPSELQKDFAAQKYATNPYIGKVLGTVGVLQQSDLQTAPNGRKLLVQNKFPYTLGPDCGQPASAPPAAPAIEPRFSIRSGLTTPAPQAPTANLGATLALVNPETRTVSLDLISTFPECNVKTNTKLNLGPMQLDLLYGSGDRVSIGPIPNDQQTYEASAGLLNVSWADNPQAAVIDQNISSGTLSIFSAQADQDYLLEVAGVDIQTDDRAVYFQEAGSSSVTIRGFVKGAPAPAGTLVNLEYWMCQKDLINPNKPMVPVTTPYFSVAGAAQLPNTNYTTRGGPISVLTDQIALGAGGEATLTLTALNPGPSVIRFLDAADVGPGNAGKVLPNFAWDNVYFSTIRILPLDDYSSFTDDEINNWQFMYEHVFCYFSLLYPVMSNVISWGPSNAPNDTARIAEFAGLMATFTDPDMWNSTIYMPITRELSAGKRDLLVRWANLQQPGQEHPFS